MVPGVKRVILTEEAIDKRVQELANEINEHYKGKQLVVIGVLKGAYMFLSDLTKKLDVDLQIEFMALSSYGDSTTSSGNVRIIMDIRRDIINKHVLVIEGTAFFPLQHLTFLDIVDTGNQKYLNI